MHNFTPSNQPEGTKPPRQPPQPFIISPAPSTPHTHTLILLHGLGSNGEKFGTVFLDTAVTSSGKKLTALLPRGTRFIFPTSQRRRSSAFGRSMLTQWFDIASLADPSHRRDKQVPGLAESAREILALIQDEAGRVGRENIVLGGLSQGGAMALICLLALPASVSRLGGFVGMSTWLPFREEVEEVAAIAAGGGKNPFASSETEPGTRDPAAAVRNYVRDLIDLAEEGEGVGGTSSVLPASSSAVLSTPVFLGHGTADEKVSHALGVDACRVMRAAGFQVTWKSYAEQGHWYTIPDEIDDLVDFLRNRVRWRLGDS